ncbi:MAG: hypothetical protein K0Q74_409 [Gammaproteobacteria bacterium]|jgi:heat shock protein HtpX|nr:hypothetical protein [Gammaproteobacteria bacterium]
MTKKASPLDPYAASAADWRGQIRTNKRRTRFVIASFILIYLLIGLLMDAALLSSHYPAAPLSQVFLALLTFKVFPTITCITGAVAIVSLIITFAFHDKLMLLGTEYREITPTDTKSVQESQLYNVVEEMKVAAGLRYMPKVFIIEAPYMNAFASGYSEKSAMVAITRGLLEKLERDELQAVMAHELSHIRHMDIKLTLMASVLSNLMLIMIDMLFYNMLLGRRSRGDNKLVFIVLILRWVLPLITVLLVLYLSRTREFMADAGSVELTRSNEPMGRALLKIQGDYEQNQAAYSQFAENTNHESIRRQAYLFDPSQAGLRASSTTNDMFSTHPSVEKRLEALGLKKRD